MTRSSDHVVIELGDRFRVGQKDLSSMMEKVGPDLKETIEQRHGGTAQLCAKLRTDPTDGISGDPSDIRTREEYFGRNTIPMKKPKTFLQLCWTALKDPTLLILEAAAVISLAVSLYGIFGKGTPPSTQPYNSTDCYNGTTPIPAKVTVLCSSYNDSYTDPRDLDPDRPGIQLVAPGHDTDTEYEWIEAVAISIAVVLVVLVTAINDYGKEKQFRALQNQVRKEQKVTVIRAGKQQVISTDDLVVGDICSLKYGDIVPADGVVLNSHDLTVDESSLTGESDFVKKHSDTDIRVLSGTNVMEGTGKIVVVAVGIHSQTGLIYSLLGTTEKTENQKSKNVDDDEDDDRVTNKPKKKSSDGDEEQSVLQKKLTRIAIQIGYVGLSFAVATAVALIIRFCVEEFGIKGRQWDSTNDVHRILNAVIIGITILVVAIPEGLPLAVTLTLAVSAKKMMKDHNLVRNLFACETMGCATTICSDKTGTLTTNRMTVTECYIGGKVHSPYPDGRTTAKKLLDLTAEGVATNSNYTTNVITSNEIAGALPIQVGNKTECALLHFVKSIGYDYQTIRDDNPEESFVKVYTFNSNRKSMSTVIRTETGWRVHCKGAAEIILAKCDFIMSADGSVEKLTETTRTEILDMVVSQMACNGLRTICSAVKNIVSTSESAAENEQVSTETPNFDDEETIIAGLTCLAVFGIEDPVRPEVPAAILKCRRAGVTVRMLTGDNVNTAKSIATKCGIITPDELEGTVAVMEGVEFNRRIRDDKGKIDPEKFDQVWTGLRVLARSTPQDKYTLVEGIIDSKVTKHREVVAVTGDGTNDAPALKKADVGFAMGIAGTEVAKEASDIIITDDNFISIVQACMWGRNIYDNICKFLQFQLTVNVTALIVSITAACAIGETPLKAVPMLWINLIQDTLASLALATEPPSEHLLERRPYGRKANLLSQIMIRNIAGQGLYQLSIIFFLLFGQSVFNLNPDPGLAAVIGPNLRFGQSSRQLDTLIFNAFVFMTIFNLVNARCIHNERNVFARFFRNPFFVAIFLTLLGTQAIVVEFGGNAFKTTGLTWQQWLLCLAFGLGSLLWYQVLVCIPAKRLTNRVKRVVHPSRRSRDEQSSKA
ncbi:Plasma membrane calcium-transporting ATPase 3 [Hypsibius exemplaris]|uniref:Calcium-transporting ATPase n=1 Tax=Hypsibius exemplaris TaxID=2072580 RepID=A0A1W0WWM6_HYPEX|nr:Plasma membrane calcium-transporting ATPase 3 [Hypsibius exemplaris]